MPIETVKDVLDHVFGDSRTDGAPLHQAHVAFQQTQYATQEQRFAFTRYLRLAPIPQCLVHPTSDQLLVLGRFRQIEVDEGEAPHKSKGHAKEIRFVIDIGV